MKFFLGTHETSWLKRGGFDNPLFISMNRFDRLKRFPVSVNSWSLDSGGFTELSQHGGWRSSAKEYAVKVRRVFEEVGMLQWASPQDWMCEPFIVAKTGLSVQEHQKRTVQNFLDLRGLDTGAHIIPVVQGYSVDEYIEHVEMYRREGVDLKSEKLVGVGSVCRRQAEGEAGAILLSLHAAGVRRLHGFGFKVDGIRRFGELLVSADSMAWSFGARMDAPLPGCTHASCSNCERYAKRWASRISEGRQMFLF